MACTVYIATKMTGRDKKEMVKRAKYACAILREWGLTPISPVLEEQVEEKLGLLLQSSSERLKRFWNRDKYLITNVAHVVLCDNAELKSFGMEREYGYNRYCLWKPTLTVIPPSVGYSIAEFEDDTVVQSIDAAASVIRNNWGTPFKRWKWRSKMLLRTLPKWIWRQVLAWR